MSTPTPEHDPQLHTALRTALAEAVSAAYEAEPNSTTQRAAITVARSIIVELPRAVGPADVDQLTYLDQALARIIEIDPTMSAISRQLGVLRREIAAAEGEHIPTGAGE